MITTRYFAATRLPQRARFARVGGHLASIRMVALCVLLSMLATSVLARFAYADEPRLPTLRAEVHVTSDVVTLGDLFFDAGALADEAVFRSPDLGTTGLVPASVVVSVAASAGLERVDATGIDRVRVTRRAREITFDHFRHLVRSELIRQAQIDDEDAISLTFDRVPETLAADPRAHVPVRLTGLNWSRQTGRFEAIASVDQGDRHDRIRLSGQALEMHPVLVVARTVARGEVIGIDDIVVERRRSRAARPAPMSRTNDFVGMAARRTLRAGQVLTVADVQEPAVVSRNDRVTLVYEAGQLLLSVRGKALGTAARGEMVAVMNAQSKRIVEGRAVATGKVVVSPPPTVIRANAAAPAGNQEGVRR